MAEKSIERLKNLRNYGPAYEKKGTDSRIFYNVACFCIDVLLENAEEANKKFSFLDNKEKELVGEFPIMLLFNRLNNKG